MVEPTLHQSGIKEREYCGSQGVGEKSCRIWHSESKLEDMFEDEVENMQL